jgi:hypothetical protein
VLGCEKHVRVITSRLAAAFVFAFLLAITAEASAADEIKPRAGILLSGLIQFPREQTMTIQTGARDSSKRLTVLMGFDGRCKGGGIGETWISRIESRPTVRVRDGRFSADLAGTARNLGGVKGRVGEFRWRLTGRFTERDVAVARVTGTAEIRVEGRIISRCKIAEPARVRLAIRSR